MVGIISQCWLDFQVIQDKKKPVWGEGSRGQMSKVKPVNYLSKRRPVSRTVGKESGIFYTGKSEVS